MRPTARAALSRGPFSDQHSRKRFHRDKCTANTSNTMVTIIVRIVTENGAIAQQRLPVRKDLTETSS